MIAPLKLRELIETMLPFDQEKHRDNIVYAFGYGSGVFAQTIQPPLPSSSSSSSLEPSTKRIDNKPNKKNMIDLIVVVQDSLLFHEANRRKNPHHYPSILVSSAASAAWWQRHDLPNFCAPYLTNPKVYFTVVSETSNNNTSSSSRSSSIASGGLKYGVVQTDDLMNDLWNWNYLYLAGRMHKPTVEIINNVPDQDSVKDSLSQAMQFNLRAALSTALLLLSSPSPPSTISSPLFDSSSSSFRTAPALCSSADIYTQIAALSYTGDFRMQYAAEDPHKIQKLVHSPGQLERFDTLYQEAIRTLQQEGILSVTSNTTSSVSSDPLLPQPSKQWTWDSTHPLARKQLYSHLPATLRSKVAPPDPSVPLSSSSSSSSMQAWNHDLRRAVESIVAPAARYQSMKGLATAGVRNSLVYAARKLVKGASGGGGGVLGRLLLGSKTT